MGRNKKTDTTAPEATAVEDIQAEEVNENITNAEAPAVEDEKESVVETTLPSKEPTAKETELMRLYPHYKKMWITPDGFVHPEGAPQYLLKGAKLFDNKFFNNK